MSTVPTADEIIYELEAEADPKNVAGMARYGISTETALGVPVPALRDHARSIKHAAGRSSEADGDRHALAAQLWDSGIHEARILAALVDAPSQVTVEQMEAWSADFDSWDVCDQVCSNLFGKTPFAYDKAFEWAERDEEYVKRAGFVLMAALAVHDKDAGHERFVEMLPVIEAQASDGRNFVKKSVNWALRQIGKRDLALNRAAVELAGVLAESDDRTERWVGKDAHKELTSDKVRSRLGG